ncbi:DUF2358 family protein (DUF2358) [Rhynchospora pubera]|uniref:DUF2358 family protein (DUF2358) n=1 Tax=Rhynchospora pubera TaxID=906938 RepID=A0AAV8DE86_9POAL|nr:DUF2358 family protein (DUF2358) [Rhynchospora pubera]KAJ4818401.1 DUF2358 family protein (DUF2358) [Rhynchospora pubera]
MALLFSLMEISPLPMSTKAHKGRGASARVCSCRCAKVKDEKTEAKAGRVIRVSDPIKGSGLETLLSGPLLRGDCDSSSSPSSVSTVQEKNEDKRDYYVNMGYAIRTLREEFTEIFYKEPSFDIYREDIVFKDPFNTFTGLDNYKRIFRALRFCGQLLFKSLLIDIVSIWQPSENIVMIRWILHGVPRVPWDSHGRFDGTSEYKLDKNGKIYEHRVDNVALNTPMKYRVTPVAELARLIGCPSTPKPTYYKALPVPVLSRLAWVRCFLGFYLALSLVYAAKG